MSIGCGRCSKQMIAGVASQLDFDEVTMPNQRSTVCLFSVMMLCATAAYAVPAQNHQVKVINGSISHDHQFDDEIAALSDQAQRRQDSLDRLSEALSSNVSRPQYAIQMENNNPYMLAVRPVRQGVITSGFGPRRLFGRSFHKGVDFGAPTGTPIYATGAGVVTYSGWRSGYGKLVEIDHGNGYVTRYGHASKLLVEVGQQVRANQHIAAVGNTGDSTGPHLHYEVLHQGQHKNPATYLAMAEQVDSADISTPRFSGRAVIERAITPEEEQMVRDSLR